VPHDTPLSVFIADDHPLFLDAIAQAVAARPDLEVAGCAADGEHAAAAIAELRPDVALLDMRLPGLSGQDILNKLRALGLATRIVFLSGHVESDLIYSALAAGAAGYLSKESDRVHVCDAVAAAGRGKVVLSPEVQDRLASSIRARDGAPALTSRESAILALAADGLSTREIAGRLGVASATVKTHLHSVYHKLEVRDRASAVAAALRRGLLA
jgi:two-component system nitrate/nitrite response regulator NarL